MKIVSVANQKGGVGKSTTAQALGAGLELEKKKVLFIDLDPQGNLSANIGAKNSEITIYDVIAHQTDINKAIQIISGKSIISSSPKLSSADIEFNLPGREYKLQKALQNLNKNYDYIIIDTPPSLNTLTVNALTASNYIIIPSEADISSIQGITQLKNTIDAIKEYCNPNLAILGILITRYSRTIISKDLFETIQKIANQIGTFTYKIPIRECIAIKESKTQQQDIFSYALKSNASIDYKEFIKEFLKKENEV